MLKNEVFAPLRLRSAQSLGDGAILSDPSLIARAHARGEVAHPIPRADRPGRCGRGGTGVEQTLRWHGRTGGGGVLTPTLPGGVVAHAEPAAVRSTRPQRAVLPDMQAVARARPCRPVTGAVARAVMRTRARGAGGTGPRRGASAETGVRVARAVPVAGARA